AADRGTVGVRLDAEHVVVSAFFLLGAHRLLLCLAPLSTILACASMSCLICRVTACRRAGRNAETTASTDGGWRRWEVSVGTSADADHKQNADDVDEHDFDDLGPGMVWRLCDECRDPHAVCDDGQDDEHAGDCDADHASDHGWPSLRWRLSL